MAILRNLSTFVLLIQLVNFSTANIEGNSAENLRNASTISLINEPNKGPENDPEKVTPLKSVDNISLPLETTTSLSGLIKEEKKIEAELKTVLELAALSGQLIVLSNSQTEKSNLNNIVSEPLVMIKDSSTTSQSPISPSKTNDDQETAQSQVRTRTTSRDYDNHEDIEDIEDLLAVAEYEPQKLDARREDATSTETSIAESTSHGLPEELHYDVPKRRNSSEITKRPNTQSTRSTTPKTYLVDSPTFSTATESSRASSQDHKDPTASRLQLPEYNNKAERRKSSRPSNFREKLPSHQEPWQRGPRHLKSILPASSTDPPTFVLPRMPDRDSEYPKVNRSQLEIVRNVSASRRQEFRPLRRAESPENLPLTYPMVSTNQFLKTPQGEYHVAPTVTAKQSLSANRRNDDYFEPEIPEIRSTPNHHQPSAFKRYHEPSPIPERLPYPYPTIPTATNEPHTPTVSAESESIESEGPGDKAYDYYEDSIEPRQPSQPKRHPIENSREATSPGELIPTYDDSYDNKVDPNSPKLYQNGAEPLPNSAEPDYDSYETDEVTAEPKLRSRQPELPPAARKLPIVVTNRFVAAPKRAIDHGDLKSTIDPSRGANLVITPNYPYRNVYPNKKPIVADVRNIEEKSEVVRDHPRRFHQPKKVYERPEDSEDRTSRLGVIGAPLPYRNDDTEHYVNPDDNKNHRLANIPNRQRTVAKGNGQDDGTQFEKTPGFSASPQVTSFDPQSTRIAPVQLPNHGHPKSSPVVNRYVSSDYKIHSPISSTQRQNFDSSDGQSGKQIPSYNYYDSWKSINGPVKPALDPRDPGAYGSRVRSSKLPEQQKPLPSPTSIHETTSSNLLNNHSSERKILPARNHVEPAESVHRSDTVPDAQDYEDEVPASSGHEEHHEAHAEVKKDEGGDEESEKGGGEKHEEGHHNSSGEKGEKDYKEWHEYDKGKKGHHDKEDHDNEYHEEKGGKKKHEEESGYHKEHHHGEKGSKDSEFGEKGKHEKGHSTKGEHVIHKKDEYEKKTEFYDESHQPDGDEKEGEYHHEHEHKKGGHEKIGHHDSAFNVDKYGKKGQHEKGQHWHEIKGHEKKDGHEEDHSHEEKYGKKGGHEEGEKWSHNNGDKEQR